MADVDMTDAPPAAAAPKEKKVVAKKGAESLADGKKRFEVKKVIAIQCSTKRPALIPCCSGTL